ncbi:MAG: carboxypeptidase-like regulatory domain-containing protein, partial [Cytophagales bacterium]|nr:carboxypeptidase-like regulatory domain-containing protein [Cytophagales bacterium]
MRKTSFAFLYFLLTSATILAQETIIKGKVTDNETGEGVPFAVVFFKGTKIATQTDFDGRYTLKTFSPKDTLIAQ